MIFIIISIFESGVGNQHENLGGVGCFAQHDTNKCDRSSYPVLTYARARSQFSATYVSNRGVPTSICGNRTRQFSVFGSQFSAVHPFGPIFFPPCSFRQLAKRCRSNNTSATADKLSPIRPINNRIHLIEQQYITSVKKKAFRQENKSIEYTQQNRQTIR